MNTNHLNAKRRTAMYVSLDDGWVCRNAGHGFVLLMVRVVFDVSGNLYRQIDGFPICFYSPTEGFYSILNDDAQYETKQHAPLVLAP